MFVDINWNNIIRGINVSLDLKCNLTDLVVFRVLCSLFCLLSVFTVWAAHVKTNWKEEADLNRRF